MNSIMRFGGLALLGCSLAGCALGPVSARQRAEAPNDVAEDHPHPPATMINAPLDGSMDKLHCWNNGQDTVCKRQASP